MKLGGDDLPLHSSKPNSGEFTTEWNTTGMEPTKRSARDDVVVSLQVENELSISYKY
jgi:hypothetical protein